ncbi:MAG TPA: hypothetical protein VND93_11965 [Myxococcales bacterium]|nr:hypothetical protein [Myxococcales bacterium]
MGAGMSEEMDVKRVGKSGQISLGKQHAGQYFRQERHGDGSIVLTPVVVVPRSHWTVRDQAKIKRALAWAAKHPPKETDLDELMAQAERPRQKVARGR